MFHNKLKITEPKLTILLIAVIFMLTSAVVWINLAKQRTIDRSKIPEKVETSKGFQRWITNLKNKDLLIEADEFKFIEDNEIYNTKWMIVKSLDEPGVQQEYDQNIKSHTGLKKVVFSPSNRAYLDYRDELRDGYKANEIHYYGLKEDKLIDARLVDCSTRANCYFDRAFFLDNDVFVVTELSRTIDKKDQTTPVCNVQETCQYSFKIHVIDLINNIRVVYESKPFDVILEKFKPKL